jgi:hypothetical protein
MAIGHVVTRGYGTGTFDGEIRQVVLRGFFDSAVVPVQVDQVPNIVVKANTGSYDFPLEQYFTGETSFSITGSAIGITFNTTTGVLTVNSATASGTSTFTVTAINGAGSTVGNSFTVKISTSKVSPDARDYED